MDSGVLEVGIGPVGTTQTLSSTCGVSFLKTNEIWMSIFQMDSGVLGVGIGPVGTIQTLSSTSGAPFLKTSENLMSLFRWIQAYWELV